jgi:hypothetical protein
MKPTSYLSILLAASGFISTSELQAKAKPAHPQPTPTETKKATAAKAGISPQELAKLKNVPATIKKPQGNFTLVAVIEGVEVNKKLTQSLKIVGAQRQRLAQLTRQFEQTAANLPQQRELLATQINGLRKALQTNLQFMAKNFAYSLNYNYLLIPHQAELVSMIKKDGKITTKVVHEFKDANSYNDCQDKRTAYFKMRETQMQKIQASQKKSDSSNELPKVTPTPEMKKAQKELIQLYQYDPEKNYQVNFKKTAIYAQRIK